MRKISFAVIVTLFAVSVISCEKPTETPNETKSSATQTKELQSNDAKTTVAKPSVTSSTQTTATPADSLGLIFPKPPKQCDVGVSINLKIIGADSRRYEFRWMVKDQKWNAQPWNAMDEYSFTPEKPGRYAFTVRIREKGSKNTYEKYLGPCTVRQ